MTKNVSALPRYGARMRPNASSFFLLMAPTRIGTMEISFLIEGSCLEGLEELLDDIPIKYLADIGEVHLDTVLILVSAQFHLRELSSLVQFVDGWKMVIRQEENSKKGVY
jgi:hypothetical protein